jgi:hypothetical protein
MKALLISTGLIVFAAISATADTRSTTQYFVVLDSKTKTCTVVDKKPKTIIARVVGDGTYRTEAEAENGMKIIKVCIK